MALTALAIGVGIGILSSQLNRPASAETDVDLKLQQIINTRIENTFSTSRKYETVINNISKNSIVIRDSNLRNVSVGAIKQSIDSSVFTSISSKYDIDWSASNDIERVTDIVQSALLEVMTEALAAKASSDVSVDQTINANIDAINTITTEIVRKISIANESLNEIIWDNVNFDDVTIESIDQHAVSLTSTMSEIIEKQGVDIDNEVTDSLTSKQDLDLSVKTKATGGLVLFIILLIIFMIFGGSSEGKSQNTNEVLGEDILKKVKDLINV